MQRSFQRLLAVDTAVFRVRFTGFRWTGVWGQQIFTLLYFILLRGSILRQLQ